MPLRKRALWAMTFCLFVGQVVLHAKPQEKPVSHKTEEKPLKATGTGVTVRAMLTPDRYSQGYFQGAVSAPAWKVTLTIQNHTDEELQLGESLMVFEKARDNWLYAGSYIAREAEKKVPHLERIKLRYDLDWGYEVDAKGSYFLIFAAGGRFSFTMGHSDPYVGLGYGRVSPRAERTIETQVPFPFSVKDEVREYVGVVAPSVRPIRTGPAVTTRTVMRFSMGSERREAAEPTQKQTVSMRVADLRALASDEKQDLWQRIFALNWLAEIDVPAAIPLLIEAATSKTNPDVFRNVASVNLGTWKVNAAVQPLIGVVQQADNLTVRRWALDALGDIGDAAAAPTVRAHLDAADESVAGAAIEAIGKLKDNEAVPALLTILRDKKKDKRHGEAATALGTIASPDAVAGLIELLRGTDEQVRKSAAAQLGKTRSPQAVSPLISANADAKASREFRSTVLSSLAELGGAEALAELRRSAEDDKEETRDSALNALGEMKDAAGSAAVIELAERAVYPSRLKAVSILSGKKKTEALPALRRIIADAQAPSKVRQEACDGVREMKDAQAVPSLVGVMNDADGELYGKALRALSAIGGKEAIPIAVAALESRHADVRYRAAAVLREAKATSSVPSLWQAYQRETDSSPARETVHALREFKFSNPTAATFLAARLDPKTNKIWSEDIDLLKHLGGADAVAALRRAADSDNDQFRREAFNALAEMPGPSGVGALIELAERSGYEHRDRAIESLNWKKRTEALPALRRIVADAQAPSKVRRDACSGLEELKDEQAAQALLTAANDADGDLYRCALRALRVIGAKEVVPAAKAALASSHSEVRQEATSLLKDSKLPDSVPPLWQAYQRETETWPAQQMADALIEMKFADAGAVAFLSSRLDPKANKHVAQDIRLLAHLGGAEAVAALRRAAESGDPRMTREALDALADMKDPAGVVTLIELVERPSFAQRDQAIQIINWKKKTEGLAALRRIVADTQAPSKLREDACDALQNMKDAAGIPSLLAAANDADSHVYVKAIAALATIGGKEVPAALIAALASRHAPVRERAAGLIREHKPPDALAPLWQAYQRETDERPANDMATALIELKFSDQSAVAFLMPRLDPKKNKLWYEDVRLLRHLTGQPFGPEHKYVGNRERDAELAKWHDWWAQKK